MCDENETVYSLLIEAKSKALDDDTIFWTNYKEKEALLTAIDKAVMCAKNVTKIPPAVDSRFQSDRV